MPSLGSPDCGSDLCDPGGLISDARLNNIHGRRTGMSDPFDSPTRPSLIPTTPPRQLDHETKSDKVLLELFLDVADHMEFEVWRVRKARLVQAFHEQRENNAAPVTEDDVARVVHVLAGFAIDRDAIGRLSYGQVLIIDRYYAMMRWLTDGAEHAGSGQDADRILGGLF
jgi:hypothetical protein